MTPPPTTFALALLAMNLITFALYGLDKRAARLGHRRVSEYALLLMGFLGGTVGAVLGQQIFRHKTKKRSFQLRFILLTFLQIMLVVAWWMGFFG